VGISSLRHPCDWRTAQTTMNYPDEEHWSWQRYALDDNPRRSLFRIKSGENPHLPAGYREDMADAFSRDSGLLQRLVLGQPGFVPQGELVTPEFDLAKHKAEVDFEPYPGVTGLRFWDGGLNPTCIWGQLTPRGYLRILARASG
jgi:hypothetical protein